MKPSARGLFRRDGVFVTLDVTNGDGYMHVAKKAAQLLGVVGPESDLRLFRLRGALIPLSEEWTVGEHKRRAHVGADFVQLGVAPFGIRDACIATKGSPARRVSNPCTSKIPGVSEKSLSTFGNLSVGYTKFSLVEGWDLEAGLKSRESVYGDLTQSERADIDENNFQPKDFGYEVCYLSVDGKEVLCSQGDAKQLKVVGHKGTDLKVVQQSPVKIERTSLATPCALYCVAHPHRCDTVYEWRAVPESVLDPVLSSSPVLFVNTSGGFTCTVTIDGESVQSDLVMVHFVPSSTGTSSQSSHSSVGSASSHGADDLASSGIMEFSGLEVSQATSNFSDDKRIGIGGFGSVFRGTLRHAHVAIKRLSQEGESAIARTVCLLCPTSQMQLHTEVMALAKFRHRNLVQLMGFVKSPPCVVYEFMQESSLYHNLHEVSGPLSWERRCSVLKDTLSGLVYLHAGNMVHQDIKSSNILIDMHGTGKIGDFGFCKQLPVVVGGKTTFAAKSFARSEGYYPTELSHGQYGPRSDVYSFGIVVLETFTALKAYSEDRVDRKIADHCQDQIHDQEEFVSIADKRVGQCPVDMVTVFFKIVKSCLKTLSKRPRSHEVLEMWCAHKD